MITKEQALTENYFHEGKCFLVGNRHKGASYRRNGKTKLWKTRPDSFRVPIKRGLYGPYGYITEKNASCFHTEDDCPVIKEMRNRTASLLTLL